jgi:catalase
MSAPLTPQTAIDIIEKVAGTQAGYRRAHARGLALRGTFRAHPEAKARSQAEHLQGGPIPCVVRLSNASGNPCAPDRSDPGSGRVLGLGIRFDLPSGAQASWAGINIPLFPARTPEEFLKLTEAQRPGPGGKPNLLRLILHILGHLHTLASIKSIKGLKPSGSFATEAYHGLHAYYLIDGQGKRRAFRYHWLPQNPVTADAAAIKGRPGQYLLEEIRARLAAAPVAWELVAELAEAGDSLTDPSAAWPQGRQKVPLGRLTLASVHEDQRAAEMLVFDPTGVPPGIGLSEDPILKFRSQAYGVSFERRSREHRSGPAPVDMGQ